MRLAAVEAIGDHRCRHARALSAADAERPRASIRIEAARALAGPTEARLAATDRDAFAKALAEYVAVQNYNADRPEGRMNLANLYATRGDVERAIAEFRKALEIDPTSVEARVNLADVYRARGAEAEAEAVLREGIAKTPRAAALHHALGLSLRPAEAFSRRAARARARRRSSRRTTPALLTCTRSR